MGNTPFPFFTHGTFVPSAPGFSCMRKQQPSSDPMRLAHVTSFPCPQGPPPSLYGPILKGILISLTINKVNKSLKEMDFSQAIHTFFSSGKFAPLLRVPFYPVRPTDGPAPNGHAYPTKSAYPAPASRNKSAGESFTCSPRCPALT